MISFKIADLPNAGSESICTIAPPTYDDPSAHFSKCTPGLQYALVSLRVHRRVRNGPHTAVECALYWSIPRLRICSHRFQPLYHHGSPTLLRQAHLIAFG